MSEKIPMSREGYDKFVKELEYLKTVKRREIAADIAKARAFGDLKENAEYDAAKNSQAFNEKRIAEYEEKLSCVQIIDETRIARDQVLIGATVLLKDLKSQEEFSYSIVTHDEANFDDGKLSVMSPIAKGLLGLKVGDITEIKIPAGTLISADMLTCKSPGYGIKPTLMHTVVGKTAKVEIPEDTVIVPDFIA